MSTDTSNSNAVSSGKIASHSLMAKISHWGFIGIFAYVLTKQVDEVEELEDIALLQEEIIIAIIFLLLLLVRFIYMQSTQPTVMPSDTPKRIMLLARFVHLGMYISLAMIAITGLMIGGLYGSGIKEGTAFEAVLLSHEIVFWISINLIALHIAGAVYHRRKRDGIWTSMVPIWKEGTDE